MNFKRKLAACFLGISIMLLPSAGKCESKEPVLVVNKGIGGNNTIAALNRFEHDVLEVKPNYLIIYLGMNDSANSHAIVPLNDYRNNLQKMLDSAKANGISSVIVTLNPVIETYVKGRHPKHPAKNINDFQKSYDDVIRAQAVKNDIPLVDLRKLVQEHSKSLGDRDSLIRNKANSNSLDGVHLTADGYRRFAELFEPVFKDKIKAGDVVVCFGDSITFGAAMKGAGTVYGETYPAWLSVILNRLAGVSDLKNPPAPPDADVNNKVGNGSFEASSDRVHADAWNLWLISGRQEGQITLDKDSGTAKDGKNCLHISNKNEKAPAFLLNQTSVSTKGNSKFRLIYSARGEGQIFPVISLYQKSAFKGTIPADRITINGEWKEYIFDISIPENIQYIRAGFKTVGEIDLDNVILEPVQEKIVKYEGKTYSLSNKNIDLKFYPPELGGGVISLSDANGYEFLNGKKSQALWNISLRQIENTGKYPATVALSIDPEQDDIGVCKDDKGSESFIELYSDKINSSSQVKTEKNSITFEWINIDIKQEKAVLDVWVKISICDESEFVRFTAGFKNRSSKYTVFYFTAPSVSGIYPKDNELSADYLATPAFNGRLIKNPVKNGILGKELRFQPNRSGHSMQFDAYYHKGNGLYLGCFDGMQNIKRYRLESHPDGLQWGMVHVPDNMRKVPQEWATSYDTVIRCFNGDWFDACQIYREWALKQSWASKGPEISRAETPKWFKEIDEWLMCGVDKVEKNPAAVKALLEKLKDFKIGLMCYYWGKGRYFDKMNPERFPLEQRDDEYLKLAKSYDIPVMGYIQCTDWDSRTESFKNENGFDYSVKNYIGQSMTWPGGTGVITFPGQKWTSVLGNTIVQMAKAGFDSAYLDSANHGGTYLNFNKTCTADSGGGRGYIKGNQELIEQIRQRSREVNSGFCYTAESFWEGNMAVLDAYLVCNTTNEYLKKDQVTAIPMAHAVYHDYTIFFSAWVNRDDLEQEGAAGYLAKFGQIFVWGVKPAWNIPSLLTEYKNNDIAMASSLRRYEAYSISKKFLVYGQMLREPKVLNVIPEINLKWYRSWGKSYYDVSMPVVLSSAWKAPDNALGIVLYNIDNKEHEVSISLNDSSYALSKEKQYSIKPFYPKSCESNFEQKDGNIIFKCKIPAQSPAVFEISE